MKIFPRGSTDVCAAGEPPLARAGCLNSVTISGIPSTDLDHVMDE
jgi:hypothetical protein